MLLTLLSVSVFGLLVWGSWSYIRTHRVAAGICSLFLVVFMILAGLFGQTTYMEMPLQDKIGVSVMWLTCVYVLFFCWDQLKTVPGIVHARYRRWRTEKRNPNLKTQRVMCEVYGDMLLTSVLETDSDDLVLTANKVGALVLRDLREEDIAVLAGYLSGKMFPGKDYAESIERAIRDERAVLAANEALANGHFPRLIQGMCNNLPDEAAEAPLTTTVH